MTRKRSFESQKPKDLGASVSMESRKIHRSTTPQEIHTELLNLCRENNPVVLSSIDEEGQRWYYIPYIDLHDFTGLSEKPYVVAIADAKFGEYALHIAEWDLPTLMKNPDITGQLSLPGEWIAFSNESGDDPYIICYRCINKIKENLKPNPTIDVQQNM